MSCLWFRKSQVQAIPSAPGGAVQETRKVATRRVALFAALGTVEITQPWLQRLLGMWGMQLSRLKVEDI